MLDTRIELLERRMTTAESDIVGDRHVSQYAAEQARRGTDALRELRNAVERLRLDIADTTARVDVIGENVAAINAMIVRHGRAIEVLMQDVVLLRNDATELRRGQEAINVRLDEMEKEATGRHETTNARFDRMEKEATGRHEVTNARLDQMHAELLAAINSLRPS
jgi:chromosome segregation ATPase